MVNTPERRYSVRIKSIRGVIYLFVLFLSFHPVIQANFDDEPASGLDFNQRQEKKRELEKLRKRMAELRQSLEQKQQEKDSATKFLKDIEVRIGERAYILRKINRHLGKQNRELIKLKQQQQQTRNELASQRNILSQQIRAAYMIGRQEYLKLLLNQENPAAIGRTLTYYDYFHKARSHHIDEALISIEKLDSLTRQVKTKTNELRVSRKQQQVEKQKLEDDFIDRSKIVKAMEKDIAQQGTRLKKLAADEALLQQLLKEIHNIMPSTLTEIDKRETFSKRRGRLQWPVQGNVKRLFGKSRQAANLKWNGVLIPSAEGNEVKAISHGRVAYADWLRGYGMLVIIDHGEGYMTLYGYNQALYKGTGDWVEEGEVIATVGRSGGQADSGLYFEVRVKGQPSNPTKWCRG
ncbi:MAG: peptidoglycan DD-metalloendopeptidase family protein [Gammaproteobacteria bacterium]|nr:peptidoglycan DD-metalloendopeptidase family protein [Gammaproteobacteria bacterium]MCW8987472.1 peptidoglycan DD-metalloendopeptidase family protein [Gammaproteobacteria bacterium]